MLFVPQERAIHVEWSEGSEPSGHAELSQNMIKGSEGKYNMLCVYVCC